MSSSGDSLRLAPKSVRPLWRLDQSDPETIPIERSQRSSEVPPQDKGATIAYSSFQHRQLCRSLTMYWTYLKYLIWDVDTDVDLMRLVLGRWGQAIVLASAWLSWALRLVLGEDVQQELSPRARSAWAKKCVGSTYWFDYLDYFDWFVYFWKLIQVDLDISWLFMSLHSIKGPENGYKTWLWGFCNVPWGDRKQVCVLLAWPRWIWIWKALLCSQGICLSPC